MLTPYPVSIKRLLTTASCSFSNCRCKSAAVNGLGCLSGPGPVPTPVLSPGILAAAAIPLRPGDAMGTLGLLTALWLDGRTLIAESGKGGGAICCEALLEGGSEVMRGEEEEAASGRGERGTELRSGAIAVMGSENNGQFHIEIPRPRSFVWFRCCGSYLWLVVMARSYVWRWPAECIDMQRDNNNQG